MPEDPPIVVPSEPGLHLLLDAPQGPAAPLMLEIAADALEQGTPVVAVLLDEAAPQFRASLKRRDVDVERHEADGRLVYVDAHAARVGWAHTTPSTVFAETEGTDSILLGLSEAQSGVVEHAAQHLVLVDSLSTLLVLEDLPGTYRFVQALSSLAPRTGAVTLGRLVSGMHPPEEVTALAHMARTVTDVTTGEDAREAVWQRALGRGERDPER